MDIYQKLLKIENPVMLTVESEYPDHRLRILYPDGMCEYIYAHDLISKCKKSCFTQPNLKSTLNAMEHYDLVHNLDIIDVIEL